MFMNFTWLRKKCWWIDENDIWYSVGTHSSRLVNSKFNRRILWLYMIVLRSLRFADSKNWWNRECYWCHLWSSAIYDVAELCQTAFLHDCYVTLLWWPWVLYNSLERCFGRPAARLLRVVAKMSWRVKTSKMYPSLTWKSPGLCRFS